MPDTAVQLSHIGQVAIHVDDLDAAVGFYQHTLGLRFISKFDPPGLAFFDCDGTRLMLSSEGEGGGNSTLYFNVPDVQAAYESLRTAGVDMEGEPHVIHSRDDYELWMTFFRDPSGNMMAIQEERGTFARPG